MKHASRFAPLVAIVLIVTIMSAGAVLEQTEGRSTSSAGEGLCLSVMNS